MSLVKFYFNDNKKEEVEEEERLILEITTVHVNGQNEDN